MRKELHVWFGRNMPRLDFLDGDVIESYDGLSNAFCVMKRMDQLSDGNFFIPKDVIIYTHNVIFAHSRVIEKYGFRLFIHPSIGDMFEITFGKCANTSREIRPHHDILKLLLSGEFNTDECKVSSEDF
jgi:hypothetical protein